MRWRLLVLMSTLVLCVAAETNHAQNVKARKTTVSIEGPSFFINGRPTYEGRTYRNMKIEGLLLNSRMVQGTFNDLNPETRLRWRYPDGAFDPERNTREFIAAMPQWKQHGLLAFTLNFQGGSPQGYSREQPWINSAFDFDEGSLRRDDLSRMQRIIDAADELGMVVILGYFYFGQEPRFKDEATIETAARNATEWVLAQGYTNVLIEISNECDVARYKHEIVKPRRAHELVEKVQRWSGGKVKNPAQRLLVSTSYGGGTIPGENVAGVADFLLIHGNGVKEPDRIRQMVQRTRALKGYRGQPVLFNEDDHYDFEKPDNNFIAAVSQYASWGYFDYRHPGEGFNDGYQSVPINWQISSPRKRAFFKLLSEMTASGR